VSENLDQQIASDRAKKKSNIIKISALSVLVAIVLMVVYAVLSNIPHSPENRHIPEVSTPDNRNETIVNTDRKSLQKTLNEVKKKLEEVSNNQGIVNWQPETVDAMQSALDLSYDYYAGSKYSEAASELAKLEQDIGALIREYGNAFESLHSQAQAKFDDNQIENANQLNTQALSINSNYTPAVQLQKRIDAYPQIQRLYEQVRVAEVEKNLRKQRAALQKILALDAHRQDAKRKLARVDLVMKGKEYAKHLSEAVKAYDNKQYGQAQAALALAAGVGSGGPEIETLQLKIDSVLNAQGASSVERQITVFTAADEWQTVKILSEKALKDYPDNQLIQGALLSANQIIVQSNKLETYLAQPARLSDTNIRSRARNDIVQTESLTMLSPKLQQKVTQLEVLVQQENQPLEVTIKSDNRTFIEVLGVGVVGETRSKSISLKPGAYQLKGTREGYRTKIIQLVVEKSDSPIVVTIECSERI
jgi:hypothetical protein